MKKAILLFALIVMIATLPAVAIPMIFAGFGNTWPSGDDVSDDIESALGFMVGAAIEVDQGSPLLMEYGTRFRTVGWSFSEEETNNYSGDYYYYEYESTTTLSFIDIFAKAKYEVPFGGSMYLFPFVGYAMGILLTAESEWEMEEEGYYGHYSESGSEDVKYQCNAINHTLLLGADILIADKFTLGAEFNLGLSNLLKSKYKADATTNALMFKAGVSF